MKINKSLFRLTLKNIINSMLIIFLCSLIGMLLLGLAYMIPTSNIEKNMYKTADYISAEGMYPHLFEWCTSRLDNSTDSIMLLEASDDTKDTLINKIMFCYSGTIGGDISYNTLVDRYSKYISFENKATYTRYWHGFIVFLRPLLYIFSYREIRILNGVLQTLLLISVCYLLNKNNLKKYIIPYILSILMIMPICIAYSLQFSTCYYILNISNIAILLLNKYNYDNYQLVFLLIGCITSYLDFLTYPLATLGVPIIICLLVLKKDSRRTAFSIANYVIVWFMGYGLMWFNKWLFASVLTNDNTIQNALQTVIFRTSNMSSPTDILFEHRYEAITINYEKFTNTPFRYLCYIFIIFKNKYKFNIKTYIFFTIFLLPLIWYLIVANHSVIHNYFTNKALVVSIMSIMFMLVNLTEID